MGVVCLLAHLLITFTGFWPQNRTQNLRTQANEGDKWIQHSLKQDPTWTINWLLMSLYLSQLVIIQLPIHAPPAVALCVPQGFAEALYTD
mmetsp:Transcript_81343/g.143436  ORF Transcript_81343/g.143436 Transcript_81343/m.143436 type:complete len:90 (-) Transcript_81343:293-562(-)